MIMLSCPVLELLYGEAAGGGKSEGLLLDALGQIDNKNYNALMLRRTFKQLEGADGLIDESQRIFRNLGAKYNEVKKRWTFPSQATIDFGHMESESDKHNYQSAAYVKIYFDELTSFTETQYLYMFSRCRSTDPTLRRGIRSATNPANIG